MSRSPPPPAERREQSAKSLTASDVERAVTEAFAAYFARNPE